MMATYKMFVNMIKQISKEMMMVMLMIAPVIMGALFKFGIPLLESKVLSNYGWQDILVPYYELFSWLIAMVLGILFAFVGGLVVLGEFDENVAKYIVVTPAGIKGYLASRIVMPALVSGIAACILIPVFALCKIDIFTLVIMIVFNMLSGIVTSFLVVAISSNKVEGMAVGKLAGLFGATFFIPLIISSKIKYVFCLFPMYYIGQWTVDGNAINIIISSLLFVVWIYFLYSKFKKKMY